MGKKPLTLEEKRKLLKKTNEEIEKKFKIDTSTFISGNDIEDIEFYPFGIATLDNALGGGVGKGKQFEVYGEPSTGKSTVVLQLIANTLKNDPNATALYFDQEGAAATKQRMIDLGIDMDRLEYSGPGIAEQKLTVLKEKVKSGLFNIIVIDSTNFLVPEEEDTTTKGVNATGGTMAEVARLLSKFTRQMNGPLNENKASLIYISQVRDNPGAFSRPGAPKPQSIGCGKAVGFAVSQRLELKKGEILTEGSGDDAIEVGRKVKFKVVKNKITTPNIKGETVFTYAKGFDAEKDAEYFLYDEFVAQSNPAFVQLSKIKWQFTNPATGKITEIKGKSHIIEDLKAAGEYEAALNVAKMDARNKAKNTSSGSDFYNISAADVLGESQEISETSDVED